VTPEQFAVALRRLRELYDEGKARVAISPQGSAEFDLDLNEPELPPPGEGLYRDLDDALAAVVSGASRDDFIRARAVPRPPLFPETETHEIAGEKYDAVVALFPVAALRRKAYLRRTATVRTLVGVEWEAVARLDASMPAEPPHAEPAYALLRLRLERYSESPFSPDRLSTVFAADSDDLHDLIERLRRAKEALDVSKDMEAGDGNTE
jgi:hypothetical protein